MIFDSNDKPADDDDAPTGAVIVYLFILFGMAGCMLLVLLALYLNAHRAIL
jgi:hypothetical protein